jgi:hypothetical protein
VPLPPFDVVGDLPPGVHRATLREVLARFGKGSPRRAAVASRLDRIDRLARSTGHLARLVVFGCSSRISRSQTTWMCFS